ncbi:biopolymer transporter ExbD [Verrucomicrobiaceae bacterium 227]
MLITRKRRIDAGIDMTPLIDVVFQLLIFLMVSSQFIKPDLRVELPGGPLETATGNPDMETLTLVILADNALLLEGDKTTQEDLGPMLREVIRETQITSLVIRSDKEAKVGTFLPVMEIARESGILSLAYEKKNESPE